MDHESDVWILFFCTLYDICNQKLVSYHMHIKNSILVYRTNNLMNCNLMYLKIRTFFFVHLFYLGMIL